MNSLFFEEISQEEFINLCSSLRSGTATGLDNVSMSLIKETITLISSPLTHILNLSITSGTVPMELKIARVVPMLIAGNNQYFLSTDLFLFYLPFLKYWKNLFIIVLLIT